MNLAGQKTAESKSSIRSNKDMKIQLVALCIGTIISAPAFSQRASLADRVTALEQQAAGQTQSESQANIELLNKTTQMQDEIRLLRASIEQLQNDFDQARKTSREQYIDMDSRVNAIENPNAVDKPKPDATKPANATSANAAPASAAASADEKQAYQLAYNSLIKQGDAVAASRLFQDFLQAYPNGKLAPNAWYWLGESYYLTQSYALALKSFTILNQQYPGSSKAADADLKIAYSHIEMKDIDTGKKELEQIIVKYPSSPVADLARGRLRGLSLEK